MERMARREGRPLAPMAVTAGPSTGRLGSRVGRVRPGARRGLAGCATRGASFRTAAALGWQMEANWTDPLLFFIYSVAKPVSAA